MDQYSQIIMNYDEIIQTKSSKISVDEIKKFVHQDLATSHQFEQFSEAS